MPTSFGVDFAAAQLAEIADSASYQLAHGPADADLRELIRGLPRVHAGLTADDRESLARAARIGLLDVDTWIQRTVLLCGEEITYRDAPDLPTYLDAVSWAWGKVPERDRLGQSVLGVAPLVLTNGLQGERPLAEESARMRI